MNPNELVLNFVNLYNHPFTAELAAEMTALDISLVAPILDKLYSDLTIKLISPEDGIFVRNNRYNPVVGYNKKGDWRFDPAAATALLDLIEQGQYKSVRAIANAFGRSRQWVFVYMEAMASLEMIGLCNNAYTVLNRGKINFIGMIIIPGALGDLRPKLSDNEKQKRAEEKETRHRIWLQRQAERVEKRKHAEAEKAKSELLFQAWKEYRESDFYAFQDFNTFLMNRYTSQ
ncbi:MAG: hypothetical protein Q8M98_10495 [Candidatus Cloacimonadaceae bacterium]|nr:hypothetical protein [Candidatus Cloacimonadaceae bacterium]